MSRSSQLFAQAQHHIPGGVNSPVRAFNGVGGDPIFIDRAQGPYLYDSDGQRYIDYVGSWGPMIAGHAHPKVVQAVQETAARGLSFGAPCELEVHMAERICQLMPSMDQVRMVNSGTEATMSAIRLARGYTGRAKLLKFEGCYHGHADPLLVKAGSGALTLGVPTSPGVPAAVAADTITVSYNDLPAVEQVFNDCGEDIAAIIVEPVAGNMNCVPAVTGFLAGLRETCDRFGSVLIFDEVMTGFRVGPGGAQALAGVRPDLTTLGKVIGGGMPVGAFGGKQVIMEHLAPVGPVYQAGTLSGNPVAMAAGLATLDIISAPEFFIELEAKTRTLVNGIRAVAEQANVPMSSNQVGGMFGLFFSEHPQITRFEQVTGCNVERFQQFFHRMLKAGVYLAPSAYEAGFVSAAHTQEDLDTTIAAAEAALKTL